MDCRDVRDLADSFLAEELLMETNLEMLQHLERCPSCRGELMAWRHDGFWQPMDTLRDKTMLEDLWATGRAPWKAGWA